MDTTYEYKNFQSVLLGVYEAELNKLNEQIEDIIKLSVFKVIILSLERLN